jgi:hypothetical protein
LSQSIVDEILLSWSIGNNNISFIRKFEFLKFPGDKIYIVFGFQIEQVILYSPLLYLHLIYMHKLGIRFDGVLKFSHETSHK